MIDRNSEDQIKIESLVRRGLSIGMSEESAREFAEESIHVNFEKEFDVERSIPIDKD